jgi:hypothetical protein
MGDRCGLRSVVGVVGLVGGGLAVACGENGAKTSRELGERY